MKIAIVDDERPARSELRYLLEQCRPDWKIVEAADCEEMMHIMETEVLDGGFVDIQLGDMNGTTLASMLLTKNPEFALVFATAYQEYAVKAFELGALDYLLKPYSMDQVERAVKRMEERMSVKKEKPEEEFSKLTITEATGVELVDISDIIYISTEDRGCKVHLKDRSFFQNQSLNYYEERLERYHFFRIYKSYLINLDYIEKFVPSYNNGYGVCLKYVEREVFPIGRNQCKELRKMFEF
ncbi:LytR/AlgR family response regulator transcription factor [Roseburia sp. 499]|uniref:LytR/AlgR family response regulator transcription factor n=1 Tax=Roseburia sp. 499 TaxID=1261634 RepID=UPI000950F2F0|nr:LytTR family DNA-binding domain-containing protein [Roseburia sp. 499]WVK68665.1 LytTR family DNA-binding domain-containing protein [Roseburia sp. 499]